MPDFPAILFLHKINRNFFRHPQCFACAIRLRFCFLRNRIPKTLCCLSVSSQFHKSCRNRMIRQTADMKILWYICDCRVCCMQLLQLFFSLLLMMHHIIIMNGIHPCVVACISSKGSCLLVLWILHPQIIQFFFSHFIRNVNHAFMDEFFDFFHIPYTLN